MAYVVPGSSNMQLAFTSAWQPAMEARQVTTSLITFTRDGDKILAVNQIVETFRVIMLIAYSSDRRDMLLKMHESGTSLQEYAILSSDVGHDELGENSDVMVGMISVTYTTEQGPLYQDLMLSVAEENAKLSWRQRLHSAVAFPEHMAVGPDGVFEFNPNVSLADTMYASNVSCCLVLDASVSMWTHVVGRFCAPLCTGT